MFCFLLLENNHHSFVTFPLLVRTKRFSLGSCLGTFSGQLPSMTETSYSQLCLPPSPAYPPEVPLPLDLLHQPVWSIRSLRRNTWPSLLLQTSLSISPIPLTVNWTLHARIEEVPLTMKSLTTNLMTMTELKLAAPCCSTCRMNV